MGVNKSTNGCRTEMNVRCVEIDDWSDLPQTVIDTLADIGHECSVVIVRNFERISFDELRDEVDRLAIAMETGTDRDSESPLWNARGHDHEHDVDPRGKEPDEVIYAFTVDFSTEPYTVLHGDPLSTWTLPPNSVSIPLCWFSTRWRWIESRRTSTGSTLTHARRC